MQPFNSTTSTAIPKEPVLDFDPVVGSTYVRNPRGVESSFDVKMNGYELMDVMAQFGIMFDWCHISSASKDDVYAYYDYYYNHLPIIDTHSLPNSLFVQFTWIKLMEWSAYDGDLERTINVGGIIGLRTQEAAALTAKGSMVENTCHGSSRSFAQYVQYMVNKGVPH